MSFIEETEKASPLSKVSVSAGGESTRRLHLTGTTEDGFYQIYKDHPSFEKMKQIFAQHKVSNYGNTTDAELFLIFHDYCTLTNLRDEEYENLVRLSWATGKEIKKEAIGCYRVVVGKNEYLKYSAKLITPDKHEIEFSHTVTNFGFTTIPSFKRAWNKNLEEFTESLEQISQKEVWSMEYSPENLKKLPVTDDTKYYLISWNDNRRKLRVSKQDFFESTAESIIKKDRQGEKERVLKVPSQYQ